MREVYVSSMRIFQLLSLSFVSMCMCLLVGSTFSPQPTSAQIPETVSLGVSPQSLDLTANVNETLVNTFRVTNASPDPIIMKSTPKNFTPSGEEGAIDLTIDSTAFSLAEWVTVSPAGNVTIAPGSTQDYVVTMDVPADAEPGSHFGSVVFSTIPPEQEGSAALVSQEIAPVILVRVAGDVTESVDITEFSPEKTFYSNTDGVSLISRLENTGSVHFKPVGKVVIKNMWGNQVAEIELDRRNVLPDSIRQIPAQWNPDGFQFGKFTATLTIVYGDNDEIRTSETSFTVIPIATIVPIAIVVVIGGAVIILFRERILLALRVLAGSSQDKSKE